VELETKIINTKDKYKMDKLKALEEWYHQLMEFMKDNLSMAYQKVSVTLSIINLIIMKEIAR
tara:strand:+ start:298 stop:483 length:186 start_codon:yes stop_codon:yes gene_type:complete